MFVNESRKTGTISVKVMLFSGSAFYPLGGWDDFKGYFETVEDAKKSLLAQDDELVHGDDLWAHIVCGGRIVLWGGRECDFHGNGEWVWRSEE